jgi:alkaline phosphatase D
LNIVVSSIQVLVVGKPWIESWSLLPAEQARLFNLLDRPGVPPTMFVSGDRHRGFLYRRSLPSGKQLFEITASSVNRGQNRQSKETDPSQIGPAYWPNNFGHLSIDWQAGKVVGEIRDAGGNVVNSADWSFR